MPRRSLARVPQRALTPLRRSRSAKVAVLRCVPVPASIHYTGWLTDGKKFDSSRDTMPNGQPRTPIAFPQGARRVIAGWDAGFEGMQVGGQRRLIIPYQLAYGELGRPPVIPPKATLVFDVELMAVADTLPSAGAPPLPAGAPPGPQCAPWRAVAATP
ncbi:MAG: FKBP-type peptidyl-prolyl cis-trans isomerase [Gemmatimonadetes bacterium]|nr:FKBP-type peptidyl-prolyl cis-trans isomerase [Gemmatimonadota bacterium]